MKPDCCGLTQDSGKSAAVIDAVGAKLYAKLWQPLRPHLAGIYTVLIAPDG